MVPWGGGGSGHPQKTASSMNLQQSTLLIFNHGKYIRKESKAAYNVLQV